MMVFGWFVLFLVFVLELAALAAFGFWGWQSGLRWLLAWLLPLLGAVVWSLFASPKARYGRGPIRPLVKVLVLGLAALALYDGGRPGWAAGFLAAVVVVHGLAMLPAVRALTADHG